MKILRLFTVMMIAAITFAACDDTTENIGGSITNNVDNINISNAVFYVATNSLVAGPVLNRSNSGLIGKVKDPETGTYVSGDYMSQFGVLPNFDIDTAVYPECQRWQNRSRLLLPARLLQEHIRRYPRPYEGDSLRDDQGDAGEFQLSLRL